MQYLEGLNIAQKEAVLAIDGPLLVLAGAGAGKTRVIAHRILHIVKSGVDPRAILAITFTNKAAAEMRGRVADLLQTQGDAAPGLPFVSTFHSLGLTLLKENSKLLGYKRTPAIYDRSDSLRVIKQALKAVGGEDLEPRMALGVISRMKGDGVSQSEYASSAQYSRERDIARAWEKYDAELREDQALDFDDLLVKAVELLATHAEVRARYQHRWRYIHIDEYQDTNIIQAKMAELLVGPEKNLCAVGDIDQTIYGWRGAQIANMIQFERHYPGGKTVVLDENYRSTQAILDAANEIIKKNPNRPDKNLFTRKEGGALLSLYQAFDELDEANFVTRIIGEQLERGAQPRDFAVLYRANFQSRALEEKLLNAGISYQVLGTRFFERKEVKDAISYIRAALYTTPADVARIANTPTRGIGKVTLLKMLSGQEGQLGGAVGEKVRNFRRLLASIEEAAHRLAPSALVLYVIKESGLEASIKEDKLEGPERLENLRELVTLAARYDLPSTPEETPLQCTERFLESAALASDQDELKDDSNAVRLMTVHASKGLEFPTVFITGLEEGLFPYERESNKPEEREEERRLMYVAVTRAEQKVYLSYASYRTVFGAKNPTQPSQFLNDIPNHLLELEMPERLGKTIYLD